MRASYETADKRPLNMSKELERGARDQRTRALKRSAKTEHKAREWTRRRWARDERSGSKKTDLKSLMTILSRRVVSLPLSASLPYAMVGTSLA
ncbi:hypothetical protein NDU88_005956 [Pleurodeles waltl]|uniref:Uncharacterized protein n=1 Tax=Pleurodeles waltl TaxID=8319 RepID=A0AAV7WEV1_PLEWA|nr:hypothetical protein NDU88_005956 [Pleurodeles waltl]